MAQVKTDQMAEPLVDKNEVRPFDKVKVYAKKMDGGFHADGEEMEVHPLLAEKLIEQGKATKSAPVKKDK